MIFLNKKRHLNLMLNHLKNTRNIIMQMTNARTGWSYNCFLLTINLKHIRSSRLIIYLLFRRKFSCLERIRTFSDRRNILSLHISHNHKTIPKHLVKYFLPKTTF